MATVEFFGSKFTLNPDVSEFALMEFAEASDGGQDADTMQGIASLLRFTLECVDEKDRARFRSVARKNRATFDQLTPVIKAAFEDVTERPTSRPSDSSDGPEVIEPKPASSSAGKASGRFDGRPDLKLAIQKTKQAQAS